MNLMQLEGFKICVGRRCKGWQVNLKNPEILQLDIDVISTKTGQCGGVVMVEGQQQEKSCILLSLVKSMFFQCINRRTTSHLLSNLVLMITLGPDL